MRDPEEELLERKPGEIFTVNIPDRGMITLRVVKVLGLVGDCGLCYFKDPIKKDFSCSNFNIPLGLCSSFERSDKLDIAFMDDSNPPKSKGKF